MGMRRKTRIRASRARRRPGVMVSDLVKDSHGIMAPKKTKSAVDDDGKPGVGCG
jgi:hypothetical protein